MNLSSSKRKIKMSNAAAYGSADGHGHTHDVYDHSHDEQLNMVGEEPLLRQIDLDHITCLNESTAGSGKNPFKPFDDRTTDEPYLESDADEQLLLHIPFTEAVTLKSVCFVGHTDGQAPRNVKMWANREAHDIDFETAEEAKADQEITQLHEDYEGTCFYFCKRNKFNTVSSVTFFISDNYGADTTRINFIGFKGGDGKGKRRAVEAIYEVSGNMHDARVNGTAQHQEAASKIGESHVNFTLKRYN